MSEEDNQLEEYRRQIDALDVELIDVLARRFAVVRAVGEWKSGRNVSVVQPARAQAVKNRAAEMAAAKGLDGDFVRELYEMMIDHAHTLEDDILDSGRGA